MDTLEIPDLQLPPGVKQLVTMATGDETYPVSTSPVQLDAVMTSNHSDLTSGAPLLPTIDNTATATVSTDDESDHLSTDDESDHSGTDNESDTEMDSVKDDAEDVEDDAECEDAEDAEEAPQPMILGVNTSDCASIAAAGSDARGLLTKQLVETHVTANDTCGLAKWVVSDKGVEVGINWGYGPKNFIITDKKVVRPPDDEIPIWIQESRIYHEFLRWARILQTLFRLYVISGRQGWSVCRLIYWMQDMDTVQPAFKYLRTLDPKSSDVDKLFQCINLQAFKELMVLIINKQTLDPKQMKSWKSYDDKHVNFPDPKSISKAVFGWLRTVIAMQLTCAPPPPLRELTPSLAIYVEAPFTGEAPSIERYGALGTLSMWNMLTRAFKPGETPEDALKMIQRIWYHNGFKGGLKELEEAIEAYQRLRRAKVVDHVVNAIEYLQGQLEKANALVAASQENLGLTTTNQEAITLASEGEASLRLLKMHDQADKARAKINSLEKANAQLEADRDNLAKKLAKQRQELDATRDRLEQEGKLKDAERIAIFEAATKVAQAEYAIKTTRSGRTVKRKARLVEE